MLDYLYENNCPYRDYCFLAASRGHIEALKWSYEHNMTLDIKYLIKNAKDYGMYETHTWLIGLKNSMKKKV